MRNLVHARRVRRDFLFNVPGDFHGMAGENRIRFPGLLNAGRSPFISGIKCNSTF